MPTMLRRADQGVRESLRNKTSETTGKGFSRAHDILLAARETFALEGYAALSMRGVATRAGVTLGSVQHYYRTKDELLEAMLVHSANEYQASLDRIIAAMPGAPGRDHFLAAMAYLMAETRKPTTRGLLLEAQALASRQEFARQACDQMMDRAQRTIKRLIRRVSAERNGVGLDRRAALLLSLILGQAFAPADADGRSAALDGITGSVLLGIATQPSWA